MLKRIDRGVESEPWAPIFKELVGLTPPKTIVNFELYWRDPQPKWASPGGRVVNIGDAAHSFLPASGNGATQAIEDGVSLASCLQIGGRRNIHEAVHAHVRMRFVRNACAQKLGFYNAQLLQETDWSRVALDPRMAQPKLPKWVWSHDPEAYAYEVYDRVAARISSPIGYDHNIPPNYPPGYRYKPWSILQMANDMAMERELYLGSGDWD